MLLTPHILSGMVFGGFASNPALSPFLGVLSYFVLEMIPHWDPENRDRKIVNLIKIADLWVGIISFLVVIGLIGSNPAKNILGGISTGLVYLLFSVLHLFPHQNEFVKQLHKYKIGIKYTDRSSWGILIQVSICILAVAILFKLVDFPSWQKIVDQIF